MPSLHPKPNQSRLKPKLLVLPKRADFLAAKGGRSVARHGVVVQIHNRQDNNPPRLGITATRKIGGAVVRTRAKRRLRALGQAVLIQHGKLGHDYVLIARYNTGRMPWKKLTQGLMAALSMLETTTQK